MTTAEGRSRVPLRAYDFATTRALLAYELEIAREFVAKKERQIAELDRIQGLTPMIQLGWR